MYVCTSDQGRLQQNAKLRQYVALTLARIDSQTLQKKKKKCFANQYSDLPLILMECVLSAMLLTNTRVY